MCHMNFQPAESIGLFACVSHKCLAQLIASYKKVLAGARATNAIASKAAQYIHYHSKNTMRRLCHCFKNPLRVA